MELKNFQNLSALIKQLDIYLAERHREFFGKSASHPVLPLKQSKVIHDNLWGTNRFSWRELALIDTSIFQRLRYIHQVGLAYLVYPSAHHTRFEHCLGVSIVASRIFDSLLQRQSGEFENIIRAMDGNAEFNLRIKQLRQELRLAALLHDIGHSLFSHTSEQVYEELHLLRAASEELSALIGKTKGAGEVLSFCLSSTESIRSVLTRRQKNLIGVTSSEDFSEAIDFDNVSLMIVGRSKHPFLQFLGDIISSGFDADKLDYLLRDATFAGLPLRYDLDRYLYEVRLQKDIISDGDGCLKKLYDATGSGHIDASPADGNHRFPYYETYRLRLPREAMNIIEQVVICKFMLFSYIYHHPKVRAAEGLLMRTLRQKVDVWKKEGKSEQEILQEFLEMTDGSLQNLSGTPLIKDCSYRLVNRLLPREIYRLSAAITSHAEKPLLADFLTDLQDHEKRNELVKNLEQEIGQELIKLDETLPKDWEEALRQAGVWVDIPKAPEFEDVDKLVLGLRSGAPDVQLLSVFPIDRWVQAYTHFRYYVRIFSFSEYRDAAMNAAKKAMQKIIGIKGDEFYETIKRVRS
jgi:HD superfamily phosphohydrolase